MPETSKILDVDLSMEGEFLSEISDQLENCKNDKIFYWTNQKSPTTMTVSIYSSADNEFEQEDIEKIIDILTKVDLEKFEALRNLGWCSGFDLSRCKKGYMEFNWLNISKNRVHQDKNKIELFDLCCYMICNYRFNS